MKFETDQIAEIVARVVARIDAGHNPPSRQTPDRPAPSFVERPAGQTGIYGSVGEAVAAARVSFESLGEASLEKRGEIIESMRAAAREEARTQAELTVEETRLGRVEDKYLKNMLAADKTPGVEILRPVCYTGDNGMALVERAPYGVIGSITPCTNPAATVVSNSIELETTVAAGLVQGVMDPITPYGARSTSAIPLSPV